MSTPLDRHLAQTYWHCVAHRSELPNDRDFLRFEWVLGDLVLYNDKGTIIAFDNVCPHRGARFFMEPQGNAPISCGYHGWGYRGGKLLIPKPANYTACDRNRARLNTFQTAWCGNFLFVAITPQTDLATQLGGLGDVLAGMSEDIDRRRDRDAYMYECQWRVAAENALEPDHVPMVHPTTLGTLELDAGQNSYYGCNSVLTATIRNEHTVRGLNRIGRFFNTSHNTKAYTAIFIFPFSFLSTTFGYTYALQNFFPSRNPQLTHFTTRMFSTHLANPDSGEAIMAPFFASVTDINHKVFQEDHDICRRIAPDFPLDDPGCILSHSEEKIAHFRACVQAAKRTCPTADPAP